VLNEEGRSDATVLLNVVFVLYNLMPINRSPVPFLSSRLPPNLESLTSSVSKGNKAKYVYLGEAKPPY
jgi:hypothetical protein